MMQSTGYSMMNPVPQMPSTGFPFPSPTPSGYGTDNFVREQILTDHVNQAQSRESQYQAQACRSQEIYSSTPLTSSPSSSLTFSSAQPVPPFQANAPTWSSQTTTSGWIDYSQWKGSDKSSQSNWSHSWSSNWQDSKWPSKSQDWSDPHWGSQTSSWRSPDPPQKLPLDNRPLGNSSPPRTAFSSRRPPRRRQTSPPRSSSVQELPPGHVSLVDPSLKDEEWRQTVAKCLKDPTRTKAANEIAVHERPHLANTIDARARDSFMAQIRHIDPEIPPTRLQLLIHVLAASHLLSEVDFKRVEVLVLPNTSQGAMVVRLSHIPRFREKPPFLGQASHSYAMLHGTNIIGAKNCLAEALVRPADWSFDDNLSKCEQPTYGCFAMGQCVTSRSDDITNSTLIDLLDRATLKGKGQQDILLALQYKGAREHLALKAGGNDWAQLQCALKGVVTTSEKYTVARSEHCTIRSLIVVWPDLSFIEKGQNRSDTYPPGDAKDPSKESVDDPEYDRAPEDVDRLRSWSRRGGDAYDEEDDP
eukprot:s166_g31.t1